METTIRLRKSVEDTFGEALKTPKDFERLSESIFRRTGILMSPTTLKRLWGYINEPVTPRPSTLDTLARYAGWNNWEDFCHRDIRDAESGVVASDSIDVLRMLRKGEKLLLTWLPDRECVVEHRGDGHFVVLSSQGSKLAPGDTFDCHLIVAGQPLYLDNLCKESQRPATYVCGRRHGINFRIL